MMTSREKLALWLLTTLCGPVIVAFTLSILWGWFVVPLGAPEIGPAWAYGLLIIWRAFNGYPKRTKEQIYTTTETAIMLVLVPIILLGTGWIARWFMLG